MKVRVTLSASQYHDGRDQFKAIREQSHCQLQCPQHRPAKSRCKKCEFSQQFKYLGSPPGYDYVWENPSHEKFKANYIRDKATDTLLEVRIEYDSGKDGDAQEADEEPTVVYKAFEEWFTALGASPEPSARDHHEPLRQEILEQLQLFDDITQNKVKTMQKTSPLRPAATDEYVEAFLSDRRKKRVALERELKQQYGLE